MRKKAPQPVDPTRIRKIEGSFSWIDHRLITQGWFDALTRDEILTYLWWATVGDKNGVSFYSDEKTAVRLKLAVSQIQSARQGLVRKRLIAFASGVTQVLALPERRL